MAEMISVEQAKSLVLESTSELPKETVPLDECSGRVLAEDICSDINSPPHDKSLVDGFALRASDCQDPAATLKIVEQIFAGQVPTQSIAKGEAARIMTGAPLPDGADSVVMVEHTDANPRADEVARVTIHDLVKPHQNIQVLGDVFRVGDIVLTKGKKLRGIDIGLLAEVGCVRVPVIRRPKIAILATGDELVATDSTPKPGQIRNSNGPMLSALVRESLGIPVVIPATGDDPELLRKHIGEGLNADILLLSGGVSMGQKDLIPDTLHDLEVDQVFHRVQLRPGKPIWFGKSRHKGTLVFGLPGNPVSSFVCFQLFVKTSLQKAFGESCVPIATEMKLDATFTVHGKRPSYLPAIQKSASKIEILPWKGSADQKTICRADCLAYFAEPGEYIPGTPVKILPLS